jgi:hypothetical protein
MGVWMELRCDRMLDGCLSARNEGPMRSAISNGVAVKKVLRSLLSEGMSRGWRVTRREVMCPNCKDPR